MSKLSPLYLGSGYKNGHSPYVDETTRTWWVYSDKAGKYVDSEVDASTTKESINIALGYNPADEADVAALRSVISSLEIRIAELERRVNTYTY